MRPMRTTAWVGGGLVLIVLLVFLGAYLVEEPLRRYMVTEMNRSLEGYSARLGAVDFHPIGFSVTLRDLQVIQDAHPDPPVADFPYLNASVHWREILSGRLVADFELDRPRIHVNLNQLAEEAADEAPVDERGWQGALQAIYPLKINHVTLTEGDFVYIDQDPERPLHLGKIDLEARNIRNVRSSEREYPSPVIMEATVFEKGMGKIEGVADFLREPYPGVNARIDLENVPIDYLRPILSRYDLFLNGGELNASGNVEFSPEISRYQFSSVGITGVKLDYRITERAAPPAEAETESGSEETGSGESYLFQIDRFRANGAVGLVNTTTDPPYRVFLENVDFQITDLTTGFREKTAHARLQGLFMGSGQTSATATFRSEEKGPDFDMNLEIKDTRLPGMNDLLRAYGNFDVVEGTFSLVTEIRVRNESINGYVKPFFKNIDVYDRRQDKDQSLFKQVYEGLVGGMSGLLESEPGERVATKTDIAGKVENPQASTWQTVANLIRNAFFKSILPEFERGVSGDAGD